jgi:two-component system, sensor histidine kinase
MSTIELSVRPDKIRDPARLSALRRLNLLDTPAEESFDRISKLAAKILNVPVALVSLVDGNRQFFKSCIGLSTPYAEWRETPLSSSFCKHVVLSSEPLILPDARNDVIHCVNGAIEELGAVAYLGFPLQHDGQVLGSFCVIDTKEHRWTEKEISIVRDLAQSVMTEIELRARSDEYAAALRARERMLAIISHDLRAPLQSIRTSTALLELKELDDESGACLKATRKSVLRMDRMIRDLLDVSTLEFDSHSVVPEPVDVASVLEEVRTSIALVAEEKALTLDFGCIEPCRALADRDRLLQVLYNLADNALRLTPRGGSIRIDARARDGEIEFQVADTGPGVANEDLSSVFEWAWHADQQDNGGTGLGLSIAKGIILAHGGSIRAENRAAGGARFIFTLVDAADEDQ